jgi:cytochrome c-type biogenesis protein CcmF
MILALCLALVQAVVPLLGAWRGDRLWMSLAQPAAWGQFAFLLFAFGCLTYAFMTDDFSVAYVARTPTAPCPGTTSSARCGAPTKARCCCGR